MKSVLHPKVREHKTPRMSAVALAEYLTTAASGQERVMHDSRFATQPIVGAYRDATRAIKAYCADPMRDQAALIKVKDALKAKANGGLVTPHAADQAMRCAEAIDAFIGAENMLGMRALSLSDAPRVMPFPIEGVEVSVQPDLLVDCGNGKWGAVMLRMAKNPDHIGCTRDETKLKRIDQRREMGHYLAALMQLALEADGRDVDRKFLFVADTRLPERIGATTDFTTRIRDIKSACRQIQRLWATVEPLPRVLSRP